MKTSVMKVALVFALAGCGAAEQPEPQCLVGHGGYAAKYTLKAGQATSGACAQKKGEVIGVQKYNPPGATEQTVSIRPQTLSELEGLDEGSPIVSSGALEAITPDENGFCTAPSLSKAEQHVADDPEAGTEA